MTTTDEVVPNTAKASESGPSPDPKDNISSEPGEPDEVSHRTMSRYEITFLIIISQVPLGILCMPSILQTLGIIPGISGIIGLGMLSAFTAYQFLQFYHEHSDVANVADMARIVGGRTLEAVVGFALMVRMLLICASVCVTFSVALNTITGHAVYTVGWNAISAAVCLLLCLPRTFKFGARHAIPATVAVAVAIFVVIAALGETPPRGCIQALIREFTSSGIRASGMV